MQRILLFSLLSLPSSPRIVSPCFSPSPLSVSPRPCPLSLSLFLPFDNVFRLLLSPVPLFLCPSSFFSLSATPADAGGIAAVAAATARAQYRVCDRTLVGNFLLFLSSFTGRATRAVDYSTPGCVLRPNSVLSILPKVPEVRYRVER